VRRVCDVTRSYGCVTNRIRVWHDLLTRGYGTSMQDADSVGVCMLVRVCMFVCVCVRVHARVRA